ncbi:Transposon Tn7 transposition protein tnsD [Moritella sp. PE36]|uniref:TnsD family Tn7-like transposition protein n=1 Tax=Moritella sp. PE36 TaxID=58051 RepID=UPI0001569892|nr:TnsD family Tn7-like transposition protein [Moritella sp. PE36]EDM66663.1 Transposon Tn7 transposition protein tnsD [Moritella sp. PE36]
MRILPIPYPDELIYSVIARYGVHFGRTSPKAILDDIFSDRKIIATIDLPNQLSKVSNQLPALTDYSETNLAYKHTFFPIYAPFTLESRKHKCLKLLSNRSQGSVHLMLGISASRVNKNITLKYCPQCLDEQLQQYGEYYWKRSWQVTGAECCLKHGMLIDSDITINSNHRHAYFAASPEHCIRMSQAKATPEATAVTTQVNQLLSQPPICSPTFTQWSLFYKQMANNNGYGKGESHIKHDEIKQLILNRWSHRWLKKHGLELNNKDTSWLKTIFRKHRKSFSYLEHIVVLSSFHDPDSNNNWDICKVINQVSNLSCSTTKPDEKTKNHIDIKTLKYHQNNWKSLVSKWGVKASRHRENGGALYAYLYRNDKAWLLKLNESYHLPQKTINNRVNWHKRDRQLCKQLITKSKIIELKLEHPQFTRNWYLTQLSSSSNIEKHLDKLPLCNDFFQRYCETTDDYQIRRITRSIQMLRNELINTSRWRVLRKAGLSEIRLTNLARHFLDNVIGDIIE